MLIVEHTDEGAFGLVLNRPSETTVAEAVDELDRFVDGDDTLFIGGPVSQSALIVLAEFDDAQQAALVAFEDIGVLGEHGDEALPQTPSRAGVRRTRRLGAGPARLRA